MRGSKSETKSFLGTICQNRRLEASLQISWKKLAKEGEWVFPCYLWTKANPGCLTHPYNSGNLILVYTYRSQQNYSISANEMLHQQICYLMVFWKWRNCSDFFGLMIVFFSFFWLIFSMISLFVFKFLFQYLITYYLIIGVLCWFYFIFLVSNCVLYYPLFHFEFSLCFVFCLTGYLIFMLFLFVLFLFLCSNYSIFDRFWTINNEK